MVPQFIGREVKIVGPLTFKQFLYVGGGAGICFILYFALNDFLLFVLLSIVIMGISSALAFYKYKKVPLPELIARFFSYLFRGRTFLWEKKAIVPKAYEVPEYKPEEEEKPHRVATRRSGQLDDLSTRIETS